MQIGLFLKGLITGLVVAPPIGPVKVLDMPGHRRLRWLIKTAGTILISGGAIILLKLALCVRM